MITRLTKIQLLAFVIVTLFGVSLVGARYAQLDRLFVDRTYDVSVDLEDSGGIFAGAEVTYRGIAVGNVEELTFTDDGVRATLSIENSAPKIPANSHAVVANKSAIGEQYLDLRPEDSGAPYLKSGSKIAVENTQVPLDTKTLLVDLNTFVGSVDTDDLHTVVTELGTAFDGAGPALTQILDSTAVVVSQAQDNIDVTRSLIHSSSTVLQTQVDMGSQIQSFSSDLALFTDTLVDSDGDLRALLDEGTGAAATVNAVVSENSADLSSVLANLNGPVRIVDENVAGMQALFFLYPMLVQGTFTVATPDPDEAGEYNAAFGMVNPADMLPAPVGSVTLCDEGYREIRDAFDIADLDQYGQEVFQTGLGCTTQVDGKNKVPRSSENTELSRTVVPAATAEGKDDLEWLLLGTTR
ncbi:MAG: MlaD family protein [Aeromicrobium sp.]|uniref:MCE family protein n=1 Tax=Aeromicrobium sp. TaxID=1871063 RepID=UPI0039E52EA5